MMRRAEQSEPMIGDTDSCPTTNKDLMRRRGFRSGTRSLGASHSPTFQIEIAPFLLIWGTLFTMWSTPALTEYASCWSEVTEEL